METPVMCNAEVPALTTNTSFSCFAPGGWAAKWTDAGEIDAKGPAAAPVAVTGTVCGLSGASSIIANVAVRLPAAVGVKTKLT